MVTQDPPFMDSQDPSFMLIQDPPFLGGQDHLLIVFQDTPFMDSQDLIVSNLDSYVLTGVTLSC